MIKYIRHIEVGVRGGYVQSDWLLLLAFFFSCCQMTAQADASLEIPELSIMDIEPDNTAISLAFSSPVEAGEALAITDSGVDDSKWLNYSCSLADRSTSRSISAQITSGSIPPGIKLFLEASSYTGSGKGETGRSTGRVLLGNTPKVLVYGIRGGYTGDGTQNGHQLIYSIALSESYDFDFSGNNTIQVTFTITD